MHSRRRWPDMSQHVSSASSASRREMLSRQKNSPSYFLTQQTRKRPEEQKKERKKEEKNNRRRKRTTRYISDNSIDPLRNTKSSDWGGEPVQELVNYCRQRRHRIITLAIIKRGALNEVIAFTLKRTLWSIRRIRKTAARCRVTGFFRTCLRVVVVLCRRSSKSVSLVKACR